MTTATKRSKPDAFDTPADEQEWKSGAAYGALEFMQKYEWTERVSLTWVDGLWGCRWDRAGIAYKGFGKEIVEAVSECYDAGIVS